MSRVGVLELLDGALPGPPAARLYGRYVTAQLVSVAPQAVAAWARRGGHTVFYAAYAGQAAPETLLPADLDVLFVGCHSRASLLAYALARLFRHRGAVTVLGGPHAEAFPDDALRFFDVVVRGCDEALVRALAADPRAHRGVADAGRPPAAFPPLEERLPELNRSVLARGRAHRFTVLPLLASVGCSYDCDFCSDWSKPYRAVDPAVLESDLRFAAARFPGVKLGFHDPNFAVRFDEVLDVLERIPEPARSPYLMQNTLSILRPERMARLAATRCRYTVPSVESFSAYSEKAGLGRLAGRGKLERIVAQLTQLFEHVPGIQVNFVFGLDEPDPGEHLALTLEFADRLPFVLPTLTVAMPYGGTPLHDRLRREGRLLDALPYPFWYLPFTATVPRDEPVTALYDRLIRATEHFGSARLLARRSATRLPAALKFVHAARQADDRRRAGDLRALRRRLDDDADLRSFHEGRSPRLPDYYRAELARLLGPYRELLGVDEAIPAVTAT